MKRGGALVGSLADRLEAERQRKREAAEPPPTFREFLTSPEFCGPYMSAIELSPAILAIAEAADGLPITTIDDVMSAAIFRSTIDGIPVGKKPRTVLVNAGRRGGKTSNLLAPKAVHAAWTTPLPNVRPGEIARAVIISSEVDLAEAAFNYCLGIVQTSPRLQRAIVKITGEQILLRRPDGHLVEIVVGAASRGGTAARSRSLVFVGLDEAAFFRANDGHTVNDREIYEAAKGTLKFLEGAQIWLVSTPWIEGEGLMEELIDQHWGRPGNVLVAARISSYALRGIVDDGSLREDDDDEETYRREILSIPLARGTKAFFPAVQLAAALERTPPAGAPDQLGAGADFAFERDAAAAVVAGRWRMGVFGLLLAEERPATPGDETAATATIRELGGLVREAGVRVCMSDSHRRSFVREHLAAEQVAFEDAPGGADGKATTYGALKRVIAEGRFCLGNLDRALAERIRDQLRDVATRPLPGGGFKLIVPRSKATKMRAGSHGDIVSALVLAAWMAGSRHTEEMWNRPPSTGTKFSDAKPPTKGGALPWLRNQSAGHSPWLRRR